MPRTTYGPQIQKRVKRLLEALLGFADGEFEDGGFKIQHDWKEEDSANPKLTVRTTLVTLELLTQKDKYPGKLTKAQIREALNLLKDFLKILEDNRLQTKGVEDWHFTLKLWSKDREKNLKRFDEIWESKRPKKSKLNNPSPNLSPTGREALNVPPSIVGKGVRGLGHIQIFQAPPLPQHFVERPEYSDDLKTRLLNCSSSDSRTLVITAIHGLGSVGKSTLAAALAHDKEIQTRFCDGILWATLGQQPDVLSLLSGWVQALGDYSFKPTSTEATSLHLRTLLYDKAVLLVVDDAWNTKDAQAFNVGGARCQVLVTTREGVIAHALGARLYNLDVMTATQAMELLTKRLGRDIIGAERQSAKKLAKAVGYLPLALELAAVQVASGTSSWTRFLQDLQQEIARLKTFNLAGARDATDEASLKRLSLTASLNLSIKPLPEEERQNFTWLGVLPEDVSITPQMVATLWDMDDERDASETLQYLWNKSLLLPGIPLADGTHTYRLHDLFHDLACNLLTVPSVPKRPGDLAGLGLNLANAHAAFLEKYRQKTQNGLWHTLLDDGYIHQRLVWHLEKGGQFEEIHQLLGEESQTANNGWFEAREKLGQAGGYITDISRAWKLTEANWTESTLPQVVSLQCRYALITASLNSLAANVPLKLLIALVKNNFWTAEQGLAYALQNPKPQEKANSLTELVNYLPPNLQELALQKALAAARKIQDEYFCAYALSALAEKLPQVLPEALAAAREIQDEFRTHALSALAKKLPPELLPEALAAAREIQNESDRAYALSALAEKLPQVLPEALAAAREIQNESNRTRALSALAEKLPQVLPEALAAARKIQDESNRTYALSALAEKLPQVLPEALAAAREIQNESNRAHALSALAEKLPQVLPEALAAARKIQDESNRAHALSALAEKLPPELLPEALAAAREIQDESNRAKALSALAEKLSPELLPEALAAARKIQDEYFCAKALSALAEKLPQVLPEALAAAREIQDEYYRAHTLSALAERLPPELLPEALAAARKIQDESNRAHALSALAEKLPQVLPEALAAAREIQNENYRAKALSALAERLPPELLPEALAAARKIQDESNRAHALSALAEKLPQVLPEALAAARKIQNEYYRAHTLSALAEKLSPELLPEALAAAREIQNESDRAYALSALADKLPQILPEALTAAKQIQDEYFRARALSALAEKLRQQFFLKAFAAAREIQNESNRAHVLSALTEKLSPELLPEALAAAKQIQNESNRAHVLSALTEKLPPDLLPEALAAAKQIQNESDRAHVLSALAFGLSQIPSAELFPLWQDTLDKLSLHTRPDLLQDIKALFPVIFALGGEAATAEIARAIQDVTRWWR
ncbi:NB-ARC domain-containing protein [Dendronalium sp. ChiSLP03b]|uniref:NB-ARC domain-containing protein n=1 Tax=Dendronalium sp. ChiSLP03b TaxID=3075381 RepID=UPI00391C5EBF